MKISVITVVYNNSEHITSAVESVLLQNYSEIEYIVIDGGSTDGTIQLIEDYQDKISLFLSEPDGGIYDALNKGIRFATGEAIGFLHSDDLFAHDNVVSQVVEEFVDNKIDIVYGDLDYVMKDQINTVVRHWQAGEFSRNKLRYGWMPPHPTFYARRNLYQKFGGFDLNYRIAADYDSMLRILSDEAVKSYYIPEVLVKMRLGGVSNRSLINIIRKTKEDYRVLKSNHVGGLNALVWKNLSKLSQFFDKY
jgi:glycosyltransferase involved in cell wall biosynthesis